MKGKIRPSHILSKHANKETNTTIDIEQTDLKIVPTISYGFQASSTPFDNNKLKPAVGMKWIMENDPSRNTSKDPLNAE